MNASELGINLERYQLKDINLKVNEYDIVYIFGDTDVPLLKALAGIMGLETLNGPEFELKGSLYYSDKSPWILNGTLKDNIVVENIYDESKFLRVLKAVGLDSEASNLSVDIMMYCGHKCKSISPIFKL